MKQILAVINFWPDAEILLKKAKELACAIGGEVFVYCPVSSEIEEMNRYVGFANFEEIKIELLNESDSRLAALPGIDKLNSLVEWQSRMYKGVAQKAEELSAEIIVMCRCEHNTLGDLLHRPDDWHLLRDASCPVLILNRERRPYHAVIAAVDALEDSEKHGTLNARILDKAQMMAEYLKLPLNVVTVVPEPTYIYSGVTVVDSVSINKFRDDSYEIARARQQQMLARLGTQASTAQVIRGHVDRELQKLLAESGLLVIGTVASKGIKGFFLGNTCERLLTHLDGDMLVVN